MKKVIFFKEKDQSVPILDFFNRIPKKALDKCIAKMERLEELGHKLRRPEADYLLEGIYELRIRFQSVNYRILYFFYGNTAIIISHGITKEKSIPIKEIEKAKERKILYLQSPYEHSYEE